MDFIYTIIILAGIAGSLWGGYVYVTTGKKMEEYFQKKFKPRSYIWITPKNIGKRWYFFVNSDGLFYISAIRNFNNFHFFEPPVEIKNIKVNYLASQMRGFGWVYTV